MGNTFGTDFRIHTFGESHGTFVGVVVDGCPAGHTISLTDIQKQLDRRRPGQSHVTSPRQESDTVSCASGLQNGVTLGTPITLLVENTDAQPADYESINDIYRPSHADYTTQQKYRLTANSGGGRSSARETIGRVAAASVAEQVLLKYLPQLKIIAFVESVMDLRAENIAFDELDRELVDRHITRCPDPVIGTKMGALISDAKEKGDSVGGVIYCLIRGCPAGLGEPVFDKLEADLAKAMMSIPATKGFEIGSGFASALRFGSQNNDAFTVRNDKISTLTNHSGGVQGGISNGEDIYFRVAFKPPSTISKKQKTVDRNGKEVEFTPKKGRHDPCVLPRAVPIVEAMASLVIMDHFLRNTKLKP